jgi:ectoine hydroxylase-related dioxygenase (phytanoyl-CoA dioxygenase family)
MEFIPGSHKGEILEHRSPNNDPRITALECIGQFDEARAKLCPLPAGGATIHHCRTLHHAGANRSTVPRRAYILAFRGKPRPNPDFTGYPWNLSKRTAAQERAEAWQRRGGRLGRAVRSAAHFADRLLRRARRLAGV